MFDRVKHASLFAKKNSSMALKPSNNVAKLMLKPINLLCLYKLRLFNLVLYFLVRELSRPFTLPIKNALQWQMH